MFGEKQSVRLDFVRSTKNTHVYHLPRRRGNEPTTSIYLVKDVVGDSCPSPSILVTIEFIDQPEAEYDND
jgi:hypothetical protein